jgi:hypothetical protein
MRMNTPTGLDLGPLRRHRCDRASGDRPKRGGRDHASDDRLRPARGAEIFANVAGAGFTARLDVRTQGDKQSVTIRRHGDTEVSAVSISLRKG